MSDVPDNYMKCPVCGFYHSEHEECPTMETYPDTGESGDTYNAEMR